MFASLGGGVVLKLRAHASAVEIKHVMDTIDYQSLNQMQTLPSPLITEGLGKHLIDTPEAWLAEHGSEAPTASYGTEVGKASAKPAVKKLAKKEETSLPQAHKGGFGNRNCSSENGKTCKVSNTH